MARITKTGGLLFCLDFPLYEDTALAGHPWGLSGVYSDLLSSGGDDGVTVRGRLPSILRMAPFKVSYILSPLLLMSRGRRRTRAVLLNASKSINL
jgi:hypothetical protein